MNKAGKGLGMQGGKALTCEEGQEGSKRNCRKASCPRCWSIDRNTPNQVWSQQALICEVTQNSAVGTAIQIAEKQRKSSGHQYELWLMITINRRTHSLRTQFPRFWTTTPSSGGFHFSYFTHEKNKIQQKLNKWIVQDHRDNKWQKQDSNSSSCDS